MKMHAILTDTTKCIGCNQCVAACKKANDLPPDVPRRWTKGDGLSARNWTSIIRRAGGKYVRKQCRHCLEPACVAVCPVGALKKTDEGPVIYDQSLCIGCRYCMLACPYGVPRYDWDRARPFIEKCTMCFDRVRAGGQPACTEACPTQATIFGDRDELLTEAKRRCRDNPKLRLYGDEDEIGGTCVLYVSDIDLSFLSYGNELGDKPLPKTIAGPLHSTPYVFLTVGAALVGLNWIIGRRMKLLGQDPDAHDASPPEEPPPDDASSANGAGSAVATQAADDSQAPDKTAQDVAKDDSKSTEDDRDE
jgi:formate dehydrogenase iron-sulfur subunit